MTNEPALPGQVQARLLGLASRTEGQAPSHPGTIICHFSYLWPFIFWALWNGSELLGECHLGPKKGEISRAQPPPTCPSNGFACIKNITYRAVKQSEIHRLLCTWAFRAHSSALGESEGAQCSKFLLPHCPPDQWSKLKLNNLRY